MRTFALVLFMMLPSVIFAQEGSLATADLGEIDRKMNNPLTDIWSLTFQNNTSVNQGEAIDGSATANSLLFRPFLPFELGAEKQVMLTLRPVFPFQLDRELV